MLTCTLCNGEYEGESPSPAFSICRACYTAAYHADFAIVRVPKFEPADEVVDGIFLGGEGATLDADWLAERRITRVLTVAAHMDRMVKHAGIEYKHIDVDDDPTETLRPHWDDAIAFLSPRPGSAVLVHCVSGISRSGATVVAYYMKTRNVALEVALREVRRCRPVVSPNSGFMSQLREYECELRGGARDNSSASVTVDPSNVV